LTRKSNLEQIIRDLNEERKRLSRIIEALEDIAARGADDTKPPSRRGRKFMDSAGRHEVSERMRRYWAGRREKKTSTETEEDAGGTALPDTPGELTISVSA
jgi:hypothetical protein